MSNSAHRRSVWKKSISWNATDNETHNKHQNCRLSVFWEITFSVRYNFSPEQQNKQFTASLLQKETQVSQALRGKTPSGETSNQWTRHGMMSTSRKWTKRVSRGLTSQSTHYRSFWGQFLQVRWPNQQCKSTEGNQLATEISFTSTRTRHHVTIWTKATAYRLRTA